jgi:lipoprotein NlpD
LAGLTARLPGIVIIAFLSFQIAGCAFQPTVSSPRSSRGIYHVVKRGENLFRIGKAYDVPYRTLARINRIRDLNQIYIGQRIFIPGATRQLPVEVITPTEATLERPTVSERPSGARNGLIWPVTGAINSGFGPRGTTFHDGIDIAAPEGTAIRAIDDGEVIYSDQLRGYGNLIIVRHGEGLASVYAHNRNNLVRQGQAVSRGQVIGAVGSTGRVSGPHLHFEIRKNILSAAVVMSPGGGSSFWVEGCDGGFFLRRLLFSMLILSQ